MIKSTTPTFELNLYSMTLQVQEESKFDTEKMFTPEEEKNGVYFTSIMSNARKLIRGLGPVSVVDIRTRLRVSFHLVVDNKSATPAKVYQELIQGKKQAKDSSVSLRLLHAALRLYGDVKNANGLGEIIPKEICKSFVCPHLTTTGWVMLRNMNLGSRKRPSWIFDVDPIHHSAYDYKPGSVVMVVDPEII